MKLTSRIARTVAVAAALGIAAPAAAQERSHITHNSETRIIDDNGSRRLEIRSSGAVEFNDAGDWVTAVPAGGHLTIEERGPGSDRRIEFRPGDRGPRVSYFVDGRERALDASGRAWAQRLVLHAVRESGLGAERRVARIRARGGVDAVLSEIGELGSDVSRRYYYRALLGGQPLSDREFSRVMDDVGRRMRSDAETRLVLTYAVERAGDGALAALLRAAEGMRSDLETRLVLNQVSRHHRLADAASREAFFRAVGGMRSDLERRLVLTAVADARLAEGASRDAFFRAVGQMDSDLERRLVLSRVLRGEAPEATVLAAIHSAAQMNSDLEKRLVLTRVPSAHLARPRIAAAYRRVAEAMRSDAERRLALRRLDERRR